MHVGEGLGLEGNVFHLGMNKLTENRAQVNIRNGTISKFKPSQPMVLSYPFKNRFYVWLSERLERHEQVRVS